MNNMSLELIMPVVVAGILKDNKVLLLLRKKDPFKGLWSLPGGKIKYGEFAKDAIIREIKEETSLEALAIEYFGVLSERVIKSNSIIASHLICIYSCEPSDTDINSSEEGELQWFSQQDIFEVQDKIIPTDFLIISEIIFKRAIGSYKCTLEETANNYQVIDFGIE